uniref:efflux RND transporter permease subunit n=1 Tax=Yoonia sp. TaxID=2212373 RepID=UPI00404730F8
MSDAPDTPNLGIAGRLTRAFISSSLTPLFILAALAMGLVALTSLPREEEPQISVPLVDIMLQAPGLHAEDAVKLVTEPLETIVKSIDGVDHVYSSTQDDQALITARFKVGTSADTAVLRVRDKIGANLDKIPVGIPAPLIVGRGIDDVAIISLTLTPKPEATGISANDLTRVARELRTQISKTENVGLTYLVGEVSETIRIAPDPERLALYGVTLQQLAGKVTSANRSLNIGTVRDAGEQIALVAGETLIAPAQIANLLLTTRDGRPVYVADVADVTFVPDYADALVANVTVDADGAVARAPAVTLAIAKRAGANATVVSEAVMARIEALEGSLIPETFDIIVTRNFGETANEKANELLFTLALATLSIVGLVWIAIGWREASVVAVVIPVTILLTLFSAWIMGYTLNRVSLFALIFSIGILVDDAIVVIENISRHWAKDKGGDRIKGAIAAVAEVGNPTIVATLTVVAALLPVEAAMAMVLGANLGGAFIAFALTLAASVDIRRMVLANLLWRGGFAALGLIPLTYFPAAFAWLGAADAQQVLNLHLAFNLALLVIGLPVSSLMIALASALVADADPDASDAANTTLLDPSAQSTPNLALGLAARELMHIAERVAVTLGRAMQLYRSYDMTAAAATRRDYQAIRTSVRTLKFYLTRLDQSKMTDQAIQKSHDLVESAIHIGTAAEAISEKMVRLAEQIHTEHLQFSQDGMADLEDMFDLVLQNVQLGINVLMTQDPSAAASLVERKATVREAEKTFRRRHLDRLQQQTSETTGTSDVHLETLQVLKSVNASFAMMGYPLLEQTGAFLDSRLVK